MKEHTWQQWSAVGTLIIYTLALVSMFVFKANDLVFYGALGVLIACNVWVMILIKKWPQGGFSK